MLKNFTIKDIQIYFKRLFEILILFDAIAMSGISSLRVR